MGSLTLAIPSSHAGGGQEEAGASGNARSSPARARAALSLRHKGHCHKFHCSAQNVSNQCLIRKIGFCPLHTITPSLMSFFSTLEIPAQPLQREDEGAFAQYRLRTAHRAPLPFQWEEGLNLLISRLRRGWQRRSGRRPR